MRTSLGQAQAGIVIHNRKNGRVAHEHYVGKPTVLGNPFVVGKDGTRLECVSRYRDWLRQQYKENLHVRNTLYGLAREYSRTGKLTLTCWCAPQGCHATVIRDAVIGIVKRASAQMRPQVVTPCGCVYVERDTDSGTVYDA